MTQKMTRRDLVSGAGIAGITAGTLPMTRILNAQGQQEKKKRVIVFITANGQVASEWYPDPSLPLQDIGYDAKGFSLKNFNGSLSNIFDSSFKKYFPKMNLIRGLDIVPSWNVVDHQISKILGSNPVRNQQNTETMDQVIARSQVMADSGVPHKSLTLLVPGQGLIKTLSIYRSMNQYHSVKSITKYSTAHKHVFGSSIIDPDISAILDQQFSKLMANDQLSSKDKVLLRTHRNMIASSLLKDDKKIKTSSLENDVDIDDASDDIKVKSFIDLIVNAVKLDKTRNIVFSLNEGFDSKAYSFLPGWGRHFGIHPMTHLLGDPNRWEAFKEVQKWHAKMLKSLLDQLDVVENPMTGETYLDNSLVLWVSEASVKSVRDDFHSAHCSEDLPVAMFGGLAGEIKTGHYIDFRREGVKKKYINDQQAYWPPVCNIDAPHCVFDQQFPDIGRPYNELWITIMRAMGVKPEEWELYNAPGERGFGVYTENFQGQYNLGDQRSPLPIIT